MEKKYKARQSCMMPFNKDPKGGGTTANGSVSPMYCSYCYENGKFTQPDITASEMRAFVIDKMVEMKHPRFLSKLFTMGFHKLERWNK